MKKILFLILLLLSINSYAAGKYDGVWSVKYGIFDIGYAIFTENNGSVILTYMQFDSNFLIEGTMVIMGTITGNTFSGKAIAGVVNYQLEGSFNEDGTGSYTQQACTPRLNNVKCMFNNGESVTIQKIF